VYAVANQTDMWGVWTTPEAAVRWLYRKSITDDGLVDGEITIEAKTKEMLNPQSDYPCIITMPVDSDKPWTN